MADIRINSLPSTATSFNTDDYIAIDGASGGTRKMLAANPPFSDVTLGASGPSVKSSLSARAPRQGLVFDGTDGTTIGTLPAFGTGDFSVSMILRPSASATDAYLFDTSSTLNLSSVYRSSADTLDIFVGGGSPVATPASTLPKGKFTNLVITRSSGTLVVYKDGVSIFSQSKADSIATGINQICEGAGSSSAPFNGVLDQFLVYNRALSASEVVALYEAGAPAGADYQVASGNPLNGTNAVGAFDNGATGSLTATGATSFTANYTGGATVPYRPAVVFSGTNSVKNGSYWRVSFTTVVNSGAPVFFDSPWVNGNSGTITSGTAPVNGTSLSGTQNWSFVVKAGANATNQALQFTFNGQANGGASWNLTVSSVAITPLGLLLAPDAAQAGGGLVWYDTSGNAANITLPASGVSWNVPSSRVLGGNWTTSGNQAVAGSLSSWGSAYKALEVGSNASVSVTGNSWFSINNAYNNGSNWVFNTNGYATVLEQNKNNGSHIWYTSNSGTAGGTPTFATLATLTRDGNLILNSTGTDSANGKLQLATHTTSAGGIGFGTDTSLYRTEVGRLGLGHTSLPLFQLDISGNKRLQLAYVNGTTTGILATTVAGASLVLQSGNEATALTLDSSQNATFAGSVSINSSVGATITTSSVAKVTLKSTAASGKEWLAQSYTDGSFYITHSGVKDAIRAYPTTGNVDIGGAIAINNTVNTVSPTSPNRTITMVIGGTTYYIHAKTTND